MPRTTPIRCAGGWDAENNEARLGRRESMERKQTTIRLPAGLKEQLQREADRRGISVNALVTVLLQKYLKMK